MLFEAADEARGRTVALFTGPTNSDDDYQRYCDSIRRLQALEVPGLRVAVLVVDKGNPIPDASWRKEIAEASKDLGSDTALILVGGTLARGVATALNWLRPTRYLVRTASSFEVAATIADELVGELVPELRDLYKQVRDGAAAGG